MLSILLSRAEKGGFIHYTREEKVRCAIYNCAGPIRQHLSFRHCYVALRYCCLSSVMAV